jgi:hypothetical protein
MLLLWNIMSGHLISWVVEEEPDESLVSRWRLDLIDDRQG